MDPLSSCRRPEEAQPWDLEPYHDGETARFGRLYLAAEWHMATHARDCAPVRGPHAR